MKILSEPLHAEHIADQALINFEPTHTSITNDEQKVVELLEDEVTGEIPPEQEAFLNESIDSDPFSNYHATSLGTYCIFEEDQLIPKLTKDLFSEDQLSSTLWTLHFDGAKCKMGSKAGVCLTAPTGEQIRKSFRLQFACSNNEAEYEGLIQGLNMAEKMGIKKLKVLGDSKLVVHQVRGISSAKHVRMRSYRSKVWDLIESFDAFNITSIPQTLNTVADHMATIGAHFDPVVDLLVGHLAVSIMVRPAIPDNDTYWKVFESDEQIALFIQSSGEFANQL
ncbi:uncharacterized protein LOC131860348 [Cryptomeria japonica]|uniref:uncharacterized protein LOC131860348 n=1 Tax=Cryptomeria japonica TaxID=3369 RepID=UPI0027D9E9D7|nr:uncharacterized protein LOC131860348 [Cryptomeria japonica]